MTKAIMISVNPQHALNILEGKKTLELRKSVPKNYVGWVYLYVTKGKPILKQYVDDVVNGTIVARWWHDEYEHYPYEIILPQGHENFDGEWVDNSIYGYFCSNELESGSCLTYEQIKKYGNGKDLYAWHIKRLEIFDKPMLLGEFYKITDDSQYGLNYYGDVLSIEDNKKYIESLRILKAPQSYQYVWVKE